MALWRRSVAAASVRPKATALRGRLSHAPRVCNRLIVCAVSTSTAVVMALSLPRNIRVLRTGSEAHTSVCAVSASQAGTPLRRSVEVK